MIASDFDERTLANMEVALERACQLLGKDGMDYSHRKFVALTLIAAARHGTTTLTKLTDIGRMATVQLAENSSRCAVSPS